MEQETPAAPSPWALEHAGEVGRAFAPSSPGRVRVELLTDPWSVWCWGMEPVRRAVRLRYPRIEFAPMIGGMFPELPDPARLGFDVERFFAVVQRTTGMPIRLDATKRDRPQSTYPACEHAHAVTLLAPEKSEAYLRALREAVYLDGRNVSRPEVAADVAERLGVPREEFLEALSSGEPRREFESRLAVLHRHNLHAYPTLLVTSGERTARLEGFQSLPGLLSAIEGFLAMAGETDARERYTSPAPAPEPLAAVPPGERVATREVAEALGVGVEEAYDEMFHLARQGELRHERHAAGDTWSRP